MEIALNRFERRAQPDDPSMAESLLVSDNHSASEWEWARLAIAARNVGDVKTMILGEGFQLIDSKDQRYDGVSVDPGGVFEPDAAGENLLAGDRIKGSIAVAVPKTAKIESIGYSGVMGDGTGTWQVR